MVVGKYISQMAWSK